MIRYSLGIGSILLAAWISLGSISTSNAADYEPVDAGFRFPGETAEAVIHYTNREPDTLTDVKIRGNCSCIVTAPDKDVAKVGDTVNCKVSFKTGYDCIDGGVNIAMTAVMGGDKFSKLFRITAKVRDYLELPNGIVHIDEKGTNLKITRGGYPDKWSTFTYEVLCALKLNVEISPQSGTVNYWDCHISVPESKHRGTTKGQVIFSFKGDDGPLTHNQKLQLQISTPAELTPIPSHLFLGVLAPGTTKSATIHLRSKTSHDAPAIVSVDSSDSKVFACSISSDGKDEDPAINVTFTAPLDSGKYDGEVIVTLSNGEFLHIPCTAATLKEQANAAAP